MSTKKSYFNRLKKSLNIFKKHSKKDDIEFYNINKSHIDNEVKVVLDSSPKEFSKFSTFRNFLKLKDVFLEKIKKVYSRKPKTLFQHSKMNSFINWVLSIEVNKANAPRTQL
jgi:hypothetical protein